MHGPPVDPEHTQAHEHHVHLSKANHERLATLRRRTWQNLFAAAILAALAGLLLTAISRNPRLAQSTLLGVAALIAGVGAVGLVFVALFFWLSTRELETSVTSYSSRPLGTLGTFVKTAPRPDDELEHARREHDPPHGSRH